jgi:hypothetical protein
MSAYTCTHQNPILHSKCASRGTGDVTMKSVLTCLFCIAPIALAQPTNPQSETLLNRTTDTIVVCVPRNYGWNMVSNPVYRAPGTDSIWQVFCSPTLWGCYRFGGGYTTPCGTANGLGLWIKVLPPGPTTCCITGESIAQDSIVVTRYRRTS